MEYKLYLLIIISQLLPPLCQLLLVFTALLALAASNDKGAAGALNLVVLLLCAWCN